MVTSGHFTLASRTAFGARLRICAMEIERKSESRRVCLIPSVMKSCKLKSFFDFLEQLYISLAEPVPVQYSVRYIKKKSGKSSALAISDPTLLKRLLMSPWISLARSPKMLPSPSEVLSRLVWPIRDMFNWILSVDGLFRKSTRGTGDQCSSQINIAELPPRPISMLCDSKSWQPCDAHHMESTLSM
jgi:hypothetical protein